MQLGPTFLSSLPVEIITEIFKWVPAHRQVGNNRVALIAKPFQIFNRHVTSAAQVVNSCGSEEEALMILTDETIAACLTYTQMLRVASFCPTLAETLLEWFGPEDAESVPLLTEQHESLAMKVWNEKQTKWQDKISWSVLASPHLNLALRIFNITTNHLTHPLLGDSLQDYYPSIKRVLLDQGIKNLAFAERITSTPVLKKILSEDDLYYMASHHLALAHTLFDLTQPLTASSEHSRPMVKLAMGQSSLANQLLANAARMAELTSLEKVFLADAQPELAESIINGWPDCSLPASDLTHCRGLVLIACSQRLIAQQLVNNTNLFKSLLAHELAHLCRSYAFVWDAIIQHKLIYKLNTGDLALAGSEDLSIAQQIISLPFFYNFTTANIAIMTHHRADIANAVLAYYRHQPTIAVQTLAVLFNAHNGVALKMLNDLYWRTIIVANFNLFIKKNSNLSYLVIQKLLKLPGMIDLLDAEKLMFLAQDYPAMQKLMIKQPEFLRKFSSNHDFYNAMSKKRTFYNKLVKKAREIYAQRNTYEQKMYLLSQADPQEIILELKRAHHKIAQLEAENSAFKQARLAQVNTPASPLIFNADAIIRPPVTPPSIEPPMESASYMKLTR